MDWMTARAREEREWRREMWQLDVPGVIAWAHSPAYWRA